MNKYQNDLAEIVRICAQDDEPFPIEEIESLQELVDKATPKKAIESEMRGFSKEVASYLHCPNCDMPICNVWNRREYKPNYCHYCGQALDWSE